MIDHYIYGNTPQFDQCVSIFAAFGVVGSVCDAVRSNADIALGLPDIRFIVLRMSMKLFEKLQNAVETEICVPDTFDARESVE